MNRSILTLVSKLLNRRVQWVDRRGAIRTGTIREIRNDHLVVDRDGFGLSPSQRTRLQFDEVNLVDGGGPSASDHVSHSLSRESGHKWKWHISIDGEVWRRRRGFGSRSTALASLNENLPDAVREANNRYPDPLEIVALGVYRQEFETARLGPADFFDRLSVERKSVCLQIVEDLRAAGHID